MPAATVSHPFQILCWPTCLLTPLIHPRRRKTDKESEKSLVSSQGQAVQGCFFFLSPHFCEHSVFLEEEMGTISLAVVISLLWPLPPFKG